MSSDFYKAFEDRFRGERSDIKQRLTVYLPFITPLLRLDPESLAVDLGCGRGEWLELLLENGFQAQGVDLDRGMLKDCEVRGLPVLKQDALEFLKSQDDSSVAVVSGFHVAEHVPFPYLQELINEAFRVLRPGGVLILETPNPENVTVGSHKFYMDPTHRQPIPGELLKFVADHCGFARSRILRLNEPKSDGVNEDLRLIDVLEGVSPDYAVVAQKKAPVNEMVAFDMPFAMETGMSLDGAANRYDDELRNRLEAVSQGLDKMREQCVSKTEHLAKIAQLEKRIGELEAARSASFLKSLLRPVARWVIGKALTAGWKRKAFERALARFPVLRGHILAFARNQNLPGAWLPQGLAPLDELGLDHSVTPGLSEMSESERFFYAESIHGQDRSKNKKGL
ncbi:class I SAM-dependent methyltransferase [Marinobacter pelagius]|uniref:class I SAM-dependent methyltransferase n=1 Tax=Marinobacter sp. C7 TaxID=2951363 RepID=UPI001EEFF973|nr:class I SAM-dependent methyltransferase [Marinobacter sp. C7]MCG7199135.1 class I SAM-dependent methyltransferase [Marinobacter sp. C7]